MSFMSTFIVGLIMFIIGFVLGIVGTIYIQVKLKLNFGKIKIK